MRHDIENIGQANTTSILRFDLIDINQAPTIYLEPDERVGIRTNEKKSETLSLADFR